MTDKKELEKLRAQAAELIQSVEATTAEIGGHRSTATDASRTLAALRGDQESDPLELARQIKEHERIVEESQAAAKILEDRLKLKFAKAEEIRKPLYDLHIKMKQAIVSHNRAAYEEYLARPETVNAIAIVKRAFEASGTQKPVGNWLIDLGFRRTSTDHIAGPSFKRSTDNHDVLAPLDYYEKQHKENERAAKQEALNNEYYG